MKIDQLWRIIIGFGCVPSIIAFYSRLTIPETPRFTMDIQRNIQKATADIEMILMKSVDPDDDEASPTIHRPPKATFADFRSYLSQHKSLLVLFGTAYSWFALDVSIFSSSRCTSTEDNM
jgi:MFS transporter, PHS family, inorganic phosphate transporter